MSLSQLLTILSDLMSPRQCPICGKRLLTTEDMLCAPCNADMPRTDFFLNPEDNTMAQLFYGYVRVERCAALMHFIHHSDTAQAIYNLKYHHQPEIGLTLGRMAAQEGMQHGFFQGIDMIIPVPLTTRRQWQRGYNQSLMIARGISRETGIEINSKALKRTAFYGSQTKVDHAERRKNVEGVFKLTKPESITGKHLLVVDDIATTGATISSCASELLKAPDTRISVLTIGFAG